MIGMIGIVRPPQLMFSFNAQYDFTGEYSYLATAFRAGAALWDGIEFENPSGVSGEIKVLERTAPEDDTMVTVTYSDTQIPLFYTAAVLLPGEPNSLTAFFAGTHHFDVANVDLNHNLMKDLTAEQRAIVCAHEIGHVLGLADLDACTYVNLLNPLPPQFPHVLMGYGSLGTVTGPTEADIKGAAVITGIHGNDDHYFSYCDTYKTNPEGTAIDPEWHREICSYCDGYILTAHDYSDPTGLNPSYHAHLCNDCEYSYTEPHTYGNWTSLGTSGHTRTCSVCGYVHNSAHTMGGYYNYSSSYHKRVCTTAGCGYYQYLSHGYGGWLNYNADSHRRVCTTSGCGRAQTAAHTYGAWVKVSDTVCRGTCTVCGRTQHAQHLVTPWRKYNNAQHYGTCQNCAQTVYEYHYPHMNNGRCSKCGYMGVPYEPRGFMKPVTV